MSLVIHKNLASGQWQTLSLAEQLANVGSEFERVWSWRQKGNQQFSQNAFDRMLELLDLAIIDSRWGGARRRELTRLREESVREIMEADRAPKDLQKFFLSFAVAARRGH
ncbi:MAG: hypothetical protein V1826_03160 [bacterium]